MDQPSVLSPSHKLDPACISMLKKQPHLHKRIKLLLEKQEEPVKVLHLLLEQQCYHESVYLLSFGLPPLERVWWSCLAAAKAEAEGKKPPQSVVKALKAIHDWVHQPTPELAAQAKTAADLLDPASATRWAALGTFWSSENIGDKSKIPVKPNPMMPKLAAANALIKAGEQGQERDRDFLTLIFQGIHIAAGGNGQLSEKEELIMAQYLPKPRS